MSSGKFFRVRQQVGDRPALDLEDARGDGRLYQQAGIWRAVPQADRLMSKMRDHLACGAIAVRDQWIAVEHIHVVLFAQAQHLLRRAVVVEARVGVDRQRQYIDVGPHEVLVQRVLLLIRGESHPGGCTNILSRLAKVMGDEQASLLALAHKLGHLGEVEGYRRTRCRG